MKKLHLTTGKDSFRIAQQYIQVKDGHVLTTNSHVLVKFPLNEVFGENTRIEQTDEFYILGTDWKKQGFDKGCRFSKIDNQLEAYDKKHNLIGIIKLINADELSIKGGGKYPNIDQVIPTSEPSEICSIGLNPGLLKDLCDCLGLTAYKLEFRGPNKIVMIKGNDSKAIAGIMPMATDW
tara:strand:+ start:63 stop:599 length:537 start_codon:yes stop_codon:yes gene_type:complete